ncbi:hypothetical protein GCM10010406_21380 [Streptomyces thermolineatus]|uniref:Uncharacterized protein n=1 Tax=Streptomyces thermolineatus TaxID=44033 RepID=A0ABP5YPM9_9ACTN
MHAAARRVFAKQVGPREINGVYLSGYQGETYTVLAIHYGPDARRVTGWSEWAVTVRWEDGHETTHCTAWDPDRDRVITPPTAP